MKLLSIHAPFIDAWLVLLHAMRCLNAGES